MRKKILFMVFVTIVLALTAIVFADIDLTPEQLVLLMKASREQYNSIDAKMKETAYQYDPNDQTKRKIRQTRDIISRWTRNKHFSRTVETSYYEVQREDYSPTIIRTYVITPKWSKRLIEAPDGRTPRGCIAWYLKEELPFYTIYTAMWEAASWPWDKWNLAEATVIHDEKSNYYIMKVKMGSGPEGPSTIFHIDPSKNFIPVKKEFLKYDGTLLLTYECSDFRQMANGLWIPYRYSWYDPRVKYGGTYEVEKVTVNEPIPDNLLDFAFPDGAVVYDERYNVQYKIGDGLQAQDNIADPCSRLVNDVAVKAPSSDLQLAASASKAKELLDAHSVKETASTAMEVSPRIVLVIADKSEYKLSIKKNDGAKPALMNYRFESDERKLLSLENLIDSKDQLIVNINRVQSHTGFASGTLFLEYEGEKEPIKVPFISATWENTP